MTLREHSAALALLNKWMHFERDVSRGVTAANFEAFKKQKQQLLAETEKFLDVDTPTPTESHGQRRG